MILNRINYRLVIILAFRRTSRRNCQRGTLFNHHQRSLTTAEPLGCQVEPFPVEIRTRSSFALRTFAAWRTSIVVDENNTAGRPRLRRSSRPSSVHGNIPKTDHRPSVTRAGISLPTSVGIGFTIFATSQRNNGQRPAHAINTESTLRTYVVLTVGRSRGWRTSRRGTTTRRRKKTDGEGRVLLCMCTPLCRVPRSG